MRCRHAALLGILGVYLAACTTILGDDFEVSQGGAEGGSSAGSPTGSATGVPGAEQCTNGIDDDADGATDCEDADCAAFACIASIPPTWTGPVALATFAFGDPAPTCPAPFVEETHNGVDGLGAAEVTCSPCSCTVASATCNPAPVSVYSQVGCGDLFPFAGTNAEGQCNQMPLATPSGKPKIDPPSVTATCASTGGEVAAAPTPTWSQASRACAHPEGAGAGCSDDQICTPLPAGGAFGDQICILKAGDNQCPSPFTERHLFSDDPGDVEDTRGCSACACEQTSGSCAVDTLFFTNANCDGTPTFTIANNGVCNSDAQYNTNGTYARADPTEPTASCGVASEAMPQGDVAATGPFTTVCCLPPNG